MALSSIEWFVSYKVPALSGDKVQIAGPYKSISAAEADALDIGSFEGVTNLQIYKENVNEMLGTKLSTEG